MKGILCLECVDFKALHPTAGKVVACTCLNVLGTWTNPSMGWMKIKAVNRETARVVGIHNGFLALSLSIKPFDDAAWKNKTQVLLDKAEGYLFHTSRRNSPFLIIKVGEAYGIEWWEDVEEKTDET